MLITTLFSYEEQFLVNILFKKNRVKEIEFSKLDYELLVKIASSHLVLPLLYVKLKRKKYLKYVPIDLRLYLEEIHKINRERNKILVSEAKELSKILNSNKINHVFLKGTANIFSKIYDDPGERMIGDIDFLIDKKHHKRTLNLLKEIGYFDLKENIYFISRHFPRKIHSNKIFAIEVHFKLLNYKMELLNTNKILNQKSVKNGVYVPSLQEQLEHNIYNNQINDSNYLKMSYNFRSLYDTHMITKSSKFDYSNIILNKYINNYLRIADKLGLNDLKIKYNSGNKLNYLRFKLKFSNKLIYKLDSFFINQYIKYKWRINKLLKIIYDNKFRRYWLLNNFNK